VRGEVALERGLDLRVDPGAAAPDVGATTPPMDGGDVGQAGGGVDAGGPNDRLLLELRRKVNSGDDSE